MNLPNLVGGHMSDHPISDAGAYGALTIADHHPVAYGSADVLTRDLHE